ncbi:hypothetical protein JCM3765_000389 [Sporobolomyces pararoseus]
MSTASSQLHDTITLTTQDNPPTRHVVSRSRLMDLSPFFRDLLTLPQVGNSETQAPVEIPLTDPIANLKGFLAVLKDDEEHLAVLQHGDWIHLSHMADKYDCKAAMKEVVAWMWQLISSGQYFVGFDLAVEIQHTQAIQMVWADAADCHWDSVLTRTAFGQRIVGLLPHKIGDIADAELARRPTQSRYGDKMFRLVYWMQSWIWTTTTVNVQTKLNNLSGVFSYTES